MPGPEMRSFFGSLFVLILVAAGIYFYLHRQPAESPEQTAEDSVTGPESAIPDIVTADEKLEQEAREYIRDITTIKPHPVPAENADNFVQRDQTIRLLDETKVEQVTPKQLLADPNIKPDTPLTVIKEVEQIEIVTPETLRESSGGDLDKPIKVMEGDTVKETTVREVLDRHAAEASENPITVVKKVEEVQVMTAKEIGDDQTLADDKPLKIVRGRQGLDEASIAEIMMNRDASDADAIYYIRTVKDSDIQGIWGIIQYGLIDNFARGIAIRRGEDINTYRVDIPNNADEMVTDLTSSFLGKMIYDKSLNTYVYNFQQGRIGHNPDMVHPGQELLIIRFSPEELVEIYKHFVNNNRA